MKLLMLVLSAVPAWSGTVTMDFTVDMRFRYDLLANNFDTTFTPFAMQMRVAFSDQYTGTIELPPQSTQVQFGFGTLLINSPLSQTVDMGYDLSTLPVRFAGVTVQDTFVTEANQGTWTNLAEIFGSNEIVYLKTLQYTNDPRLSDPSTFRTPELHTLLASHVGESFDYREDIYFPNNSGYAHYGVARLDGVAFSDVPEPQSLLLVGSTLLLAAIGYGFRRSPPARLRT